MTKRKLSDRALNRRKVKARVLEGVRAAGEQLIENSESGWWSDQHTCNLLGAKLNWMACGLLEAYTLTFRKHIDIGDAWVNSQYLELGWRKYDPDVTKFYEHVFEHRLMLLAMFHELIRSGDIKLEDFIDGL